MSRFPLVAALLAALASPAPAADELLVAPTPVVLSPDARSSELVLVNKGTETAAFRIAIENRRMREDGSLEDAAEPLPGEAFADDKLHYSPRQLVLEPGARQVVRIMASAPGALPPGEYRSHLRLMSAPVSAGSTQVAGEASDPGAGHLARVVTGATRERPGRRSCPAGFAPGWLGSLVSRFGSIGSVRSGVIRDRSPPRPGHRPGVSGEGPQQRESWHLVGWERDVS